MLRWWPGTGVLALLMLCSGLAAQPTSVPACDLDAKRSELTQGRLPDFTGCTVAEAAPLLLRADYRTVPKVDDAATGLPQYTITSQSHDGQEVYLSYATGKGYPPPVAEPVHFSITAPHSVAEGSSFTLTILRDRFDRQAHELTLDYRPAGLLDNPKTSISFDGRSNTATIQLNTAAGTPGDGDKTLLITLTDTSDGAAPGEPPRAKVKITDQRPAQSYTVATSGDVRRDAPITFVVTRTDVADPANPTYDLTQDNKPLPAGKPLAFDDGVRIWRVAVSTDAFDPCGGPVTFLLRAGGSNPPFPAPFTGDLPATCSTPTPTPTATGASGTGSWPDLPWAVGGIIVIILIGIGLYKWPWIPPKPDNGSESLRTPPTITAHAKFDLPDITAPTLDPTALRWPGASAQVRIEPGDTHLPDPLPVEDHDHG